MAACEDHPELAVLDLAVEKQLVEPLLVHGARGRPPLQGALSDLVAPERIDDLVFGDAVDPGRWIFRYAAQAPRLQGVHKGRLHHVLDEVELLPTENPGQYSNQSPRRMAEEMLHQWSD